MDKTKANKIAQHPLQTYEWGEFRKSWGNEILWTKYGLLTVHKIPLTPFKLGMFIRGPKPTEEMLKELKKLAKEQGLIYIKLEPFYSKPASDIAGFNKTAKLLKMSGCIKGKTLFTPTSFWINLKLSEEELMKSFTSKTRYNIRLAQKKGVEVKEDNSQNAFEKYLELTKKTVERQGFYAHSQNYHKLMWKKLHQEMVSNKEEPIARLLTAKFEGEIITTWILFSWKDYLYYPYGASSIKHKNVMANNLMMWEAVKLGKKLGLKTFDLWGREEGKGFTKFKEGYNPKVVEFIGTWDLIINKPLYFLYRIGEMIRWPALRLKSKFAKPKF